MKPPANQGSLLSEAVVYRPASTRGGWLLAMVAALLTVGVLAALPLADRLTRLPKAPTLEVRPVRTLRLPPPPPVVLPEAPPVKPPEPPSRRQELVLPPLPIPPPPSPAPVAAPVPALRLDLPSFAVKTDMSFPVTPAPPVAATVAPVAVAEPVTAPVSPAPAAEPMQAAPPAPPPVLEAGAVDRNPLPISRPLAYPPLAERRGIEGWVEVVYIVSPEGTVVSVEVVAARPAGIFEEAALAAVKTWRFQPGVHQGRDVAVRVRHRIRYERQ